MSSKAGRLAAWKAKQAAKKQAEAASAPPPPSSTNSNEMLPPASRAPTKSTASIGGVKKRKLGTSLSLPSKKKGKSSTVKKGLSSDAKKPLGAFGDDSDEDDEDEDDQPSSRPVLKFDSDSDSEDAKGNSSTAMDVDSDGDGLDEFMKGISSSKELVKQDLTAIGASAPAKPKVQSISLEEISSTPAPSAPVSSSEEDDNNFLSALKSTGPPSAVAPSTSDKGPEGIDVEALKAQAADAVAKRLGRGDETGRLFETDDGPEEAERMLEIYKATEADRTAISLSINKKKFIASVDHSKIDYIPIQKNLYIVPPHLRQSTKTRPTSLTPDVVHRSRNALNIKVRGGGVIPAPVTTFEEAGVQGRLLEILTNKLGIQKPFAIQSQCLPAIMSGRDVIGIAKTGSGKTLAFVLPMLRQIMSQPPLEPGESGPIGLVLAPARELAMQIYDVAKTFCKHLNLRATCVYGGGPVAEQIGELKRGAEVVVATPGRLIDILTMQAGKVLSLRRVSYVVMDEADRMFDMGFAPQISSILAAVRPDKQLSLFSATFPKSVEGLARQSLKYPVEVMVGGRSVASDTIEQFAEVVDEAAKFNRLLQLLGLWSERGKVLVFVDTQGKCDELYEQLTRHGYAGLSLHGGKEQDERDETISEFRDPQSLFNVLVATSVAGRGLDVPSCRLVVNYSAPNHIEDYVHRVGRTGRAGRKGTAYTLVNTKEESAYAKIVAKALTDAGWGDNVPQELKDLAGSHDEKVEKGEAKSANRGYGGRGFTYDSTELSEKQKLAAFEKKQALIEAGMMAEDVEDDYEYDEEGEFAKTKQPVVEVGGEETTNTAAATKAMSPANPVPDSNGDTGGAGADEGGSSGGAETAKSIAVKKAQAIAAKIGASSSSLLSLPGMSDKLLGKTIGGTSDKRGGSTKQVGAGMRRGQKLNFYVEEITINDFCREARWKVTQKETVARLSETYQAAITNKGEYYPPGREPDPAKGQKKMFLSVETTDETLLQQCIREINRLITEETIRVGGGNISHKYSVM